MLEQSAGFATMLILGCEAESGRHLPLLDIFYPSRSTYTLETARLTLSILPILVACDSVHTVASGAIGGWTIGLRCWQTVQALHVL